MSTVGGNKKAIQEYIRNQEEEDIMADQLSFREYEDPFKNLEKDDDSPEVSTNQFKGTGRVNIPVIPKAAFSDDELKKVNLIGFDKAKNDDKNFDRIVHFFLYDLNLRKFGTGRMIM